MHPAARCRREGPPPHETVLCRLEAGAGFSTRSAAADGRGTHAVIVPHEVIRTVGLAERIVRMSRSARPGILFADGNFHDDHRITDGILQADGAAIPCRPVGPKHSGRWRCMGLRRTIIMVFDRCFVMACNISQEIV